MENGRDAIGVKSLNRHTLEQIVAAIPAPVLVADARDPRHPVVYVNSAYEQFTGFAGAELAGRPWSLLERRSGEDLAELRLAIDRAEAYDARVTDERKNGTPWTSDVSVAPLYDGRGELKYYLCTLRGTGTAGRAAATGANNGSREISLLQRELGLARQKVAVIDRIDSATGLLRFDYFRETLRRDLLVARRDRRFVSLLVFEIVEFDVYEQTFGDKAAESCMRMIGTQITRTLRRASDLCARYDDVTLVAAALGQAPEEIQPLADAIAESVSQLKLHNPRAKSNRYITVRVDVIGCPPGAHDDPEPVIARVVERSRAVDTRLEAISA